MVPLNICLNVFKYFVVVNLFSLKGHNVHICFIISTYKVNVLKQTEQKQS